MKASTSAALLFALCCSVTTTIRAQEQRTFNQNASRSNHIAMASDAWTFGFTGGTSFATNSNEKSMFRGNGLASKLSGHYYFDKIGIGVSSGILSGTVSDNALNDFITKRKFPVNQLQVSKANPFNSYLLAGPSVRFGNRIAVLADIKGGLFFNNPGAVTINQTGATRSLYRFEAGDKNLFPGFSGSISIAYPLSSTTQFFINTDYLKSRSSVRLLDPSSGIDIATQLNRDVNMLTAGIGIIKTFSGNHGSANAKKHIGNVKYNEMTAREAGSGIATGRRQLSPVSDNGIAIDEQGVHRMMNEQSCGPVTQRTMNTDGSTEEMTFACPADAVAYNRISMNVTVPKQTQGATFGEKVNAGLHAAGSALAQGRVIHRDLAARNIISGRLAWSDLNNGGTIVTNESVSTKNTLAGGAGGGAAAASYARQTNNTSFGTMVRMYARDAGSGIATGKRSAREKGSGIATGRRQYQPVYMDNSGSLCNDCAANVKNNPLYNDKGTKGVNALHKDGARTTAGDDNGIGSIDIALIDANSGALIAQTKTEPGGNFFFANVPDGIYSVRVSGSVIAKKGYDVSTTTSTDLLGTVALAPPPVELYINTEEGDEAPQQRAGVSTSRSNIRNKSLAIVEADLDGDGEYESLTTTASLPDGTTEKINATAGSDNGKKTIVLEGAALQNSRRRVEVLKSNKQGDPNANRITTITVSGSGNTLTAIAGFSDGRKQDVTNLLNVNTAHSGVRQYSIVVADLDDDGMPDAIMNMEEVETGDETAGRKMIPVTVPDITGAAKSVAAPFVPGGGVVSAAMRPGSPIGGIIVKGGKNPGGSLRTTETNENGEFEFTNLEAGEYTFTVEQTLVIDNETIVAVGNSTRAQDHNSSRSNKTASLIAPDPFNGTNTTRAQDHNSSRSNKTASLIADDNENNNNGKTKSTVGPVKWMAPESLKSISIEADLDGDGEYETDMTSKLSDEIKLDEKGDIAAPQQRAGISTSRSNIRTRNSLQPVGNKLYIGYGSAEINGKTVPVKIVYKEKATSGMKDTLKTQV